MTEKSGPFQRLAGWFDSRFGLSYPLLRPVPRYAMNPFYWLGALAVVAFVIQGVTGAIMMLYYIPSPTQAYSSTQYIFQSVFNGRFLETIHLYTAYAMIMLAFMHMMRGYFVSVHKKPREAMWIIGMLMGFVTLGFGFTGYLLPWTVVSKSATDVGIGMVTALPQPISSLLTFLIVGNGGDSAELLRFFDLHVMLLPAALLILLVAKMYMLEAHGVADPTSGPPAEPKPKLSPIFPDVTMYLFELSLLFGAGMLLISALFPLNLPPQYTPAAASQYIPQPDWYFLWIYQVLKIKIFEGSTGLAMALTLVSAIFVLLIVLPFIDRGKNREASKRPVYTTLGAIFVTEVVALSYWGLVTPGKIIPVEQAALVVGGTALLVAVGSALIYRLMYSRAKGRLALAPAKSIPSSELKSGLAFTGLVALGAFAVGTLVNGLAGLIVGGASLFGLEVVGASAVLLGLDLLGSAFLIYRLDLRTGNIRRRVRVLEAGWRGD
ncbi:MAG: cytochrome bc complex cytochrome b subunit [Nitrososphaerota archaeon]|nr:cytochrome bc complex cytochrome b subunit [Nitrososphaerota archaeon]MDG6969394.1 cytochrome bc complex cytochrome b subunit [Nitrososphaerota archaeon]MDG6987307.1 cytochrome bc complex cytochrome b subunit [Nitrososphaerota archaeon]MDG7015409.1 cytochrome bc complex cytochrome b subunit [Nitrososphaerota archaeon]WGO50154.1 MAG: cytochrome bc complex cytochrome b subunit [Nitrososphaerota archaeon]